MSDWPKCGKETCKFYDTKWENHCDEYGDDEDLCVMCPSYTEAPRPQDSSGSVEFNCSVTELAELKKCVERGFMALHLEVAPAICNDLRNTVYAVINHLEDNQ